MKKRLLLYVGIGLAFCVAAVMVDSTHVLRGRLLRQPFYNDRPVSYWCKALDSEVPEVQFEALRTLMAIALSQIGPGAKEAVPALIAALQNQAIPQATIAVSLGQIGRDAKAAVPALRKLVEENAPPPPQETRNRPTPWIRDSIRQAAREALRRIEPKENKQRAKKKPKKPWN